MNTYLSANNLPAPEKIDCFESRIGRIRFAHWQTTAPKKRGVVVHFNGRTEFIERNIWTYADLIRNGYEVWTLDWPGQGLSARKHPQVGYIDDFDDYVAVAKQFVDTKVKPKAGDGMRILLAHSMGGQIAARYLLQEKENAPFEAAVMSSPLFALPKIQYEIYSPFLHFGNWIKAKFWPADACISAKSATPQWAPDFPNPCEALSTRIVEASVGKTPWAYSNDYSKLQATECMVEKSVILSRNADESPPLDLRVSCATSRWTRAAVLSTYDVIARRSSLTVPTLIMAAWNDQAVANIGQRRFCDWDNPNCCLKFVRAVRRGDAATAADDDRSGFVDVAIGESDGADQGLLARGVGHELLIEREPVRAAFLERLYRFAEDPDPQRWCKK
ncbi:MAG: alpha/beta hydrolase [Rhodocyclaceae bacterium]|nr:alpha/beta hydrolase [Rhodocyclaceae bacterium]